jgi:non-ribosomal peptide synthetase component E (peptide arylation enzyme)
VPDFIQLVEDLPVGTVGKVDKITLQQQAVQMIKEET